MVLMTPLPPLVDCCDTYASPAMFLAPTVFPIRCSSYAGNTLAAGVVMLTAIFATAVSGLTNCDHVSVLAGICTTRLHGMRIVCPLTTAEPPARLARWSGHVDASNLRS